MKPWRYLVIGTAAVAWTGCSDLPSFPEELLNGAGTSGAAGSSSAGSGNVIPNAGNTSTSGAGGGSAGTSAMGGSGAGTPAMGGSGAGTPSTGGNPDAGGSGGTMPNPQAEIDDAVKELSGWRYENKCGYVDGHSISDGTCTSGEICWPDANKARFSEKKTISVGGVAGHFYDVTLRIRGAIEPRDYPVACKFVPGGKDGQTISIVEDCDPTSGVTFNIWELTIENPRKVYYLNAVRVHPPHRVDAIDQTWTIRVAGQSKIGWFFDDLNGGAIRNCSIAVEGVAPYPKVFDGNFFQLDVVDAKLAP